MAVHEESSSESGVITKSPVGRSREKTRAASRDEVRGEYRGRLEERRSTLARHSLRERVVTELRLVVFVAGMIQAWATWKFGWPSPGWLALPVVLFLLVLVLQARASRASRRAARAVEFYEKGLARVEERWAGRGESGVRFLDPEHPYAADLDLFGAGSLFERLCTARTRAGEEALAAWLLEPAGPEEILGRQAAIDELRGRLDLREDLERLGGDLRAGVQPESLASWGDEPRVFSGPSVPLIATILALLNVAALVAWSATEAGPRPLLLTLVLEAIFARRLSAKVRRVVAALDRRTHDLVLLEHLLERVERADFQAPRLLQIRAALEHEGRPASRRIARLAQLLHLLDTQKNQFFLPFAVVLLWGIQLAVAIDAWRARHGPAIAGWLAAVGEFEAFCALSSYAYENPSDPFPAIETREACFDAEGLGHPLIAEADSVRNDLTLGEATRVLVVSGSNMSGKSTLLRSVGVNVVLALAGAPVRAERLRVSPLSIGATLRIQDSLQAGRSRFFAEITRLRQLVDLARGPRPLLFLLDEILHGTNSHDRRVGAEALVRGLLGHGAIGLVTTHDLALAEIVERIGPEASNVHFEDQFEDGSLHFDYRMRPGVVRKSNALALMRAVGLEV